MSTLIAYFSASGNTARLAKTFAEVLGGSLYEIKPAEKYTSADLNWNDKNSRSTHEMNDKKSRPAIEGKLDSIEQDNIVLLFPIWWYEAPRIIQTFLESYDFSGKTIVLACTSGGSGHYPDTKLLSYLQMSLDHLLLQEPALPAVCLRHRCWW